MGYRIKFILVLSFLLITSAFSQQTGFDLARAIDEWRWGVISYNDGLLGKALLSMERATSLNPRNPLIREWLGRVYWRSGQEDAAIVIWKEIIKKQQASTALISWYERVSSQLSGDREIPEANEWIPMLRLNGKSNTISLFSRPSSVRPRMDGSGSLLLASYGGGEVILLNANGKIIDRFQGGLEGLNRPFDVLALGEDKLLVSEFKSNRVSVLSTEGINRGYRLESWGETGSGSGQFLGPQYMSFSPDANFVYISDWGNKRVSKWNLAGEHLLSFQSNDFFSGFSGPTGIATRRSEVYVADSLQGAIHVFDSSGNYIGPLIQSGLDAPEGLTIDGDLLLIADGTRVHRFNLKSGEMTTEVNLGLGSHRITTVVSDDNGNMVIADFDSNQMLILSPLTTLYGGLDVTLNSTRIDDSLRIVADVTVRDRLGNHIAGLDESNFIVDDASKKKKISQVEWSAAMDRSIALSVFTDPAGNDIKALFPGFMDLSSKLNVKDKLFIVGSGRSPVASEIKQNSADKYYDSLLKASMGERLIEWDKSLRVAAMAILNDYRRKAVVAFVNRIPDSNSFDTYGLVETARLMANNDIIFYPVYKDSSLMSPELEFIASETGGESYYMYQPEGSGQIVDTLRTKAYGRYRLTWNTDAKTDYGRRFIPVIVEVVYIKKSGRDELGSFAPLN